MRWLLFAGYLLTVPLANWTVSNVGTVCLPDGPCLIPVGLGLMAPSGVLWIGVALTLRDLVHEYLGRRWAMLAVVLGAALSLAVSPPYVALASATAFAFGEAADFWVYERLRRRGWVAAMLGSNVVGLVLDSLIFLHILTGSQELLVGQVVAKLWATLIAVALLWLARRQLRPAGAVA